MSIATESILPYTIQRIKKAEMDVRKIAKEHGVKVRRNPFSGIDVKFADGTKLRYAGWFQLQREMIATFDLAD